MENGFIWSYSHAFRADVISAVSRGWDDCGVVPEVGERGGGEAVVRLLGGGQMLASVRGVAD